MKSKLQLEVWKSTTNLHEEHYFLGAINRGKYVIGYNPQAVSQKTWKKILALIEEELT